MTKSERFKMTQEMSHGELHHAYMDMAKHFHIAIWVILFLFGILLWSA